MQTSDWLSQQICDRLTTNVESALHNHCRETKNNASRTFFLMHGANEIISRISKDKFKEALSTRSEYEH